MAWSQPTMDALHRWLSMGTWYKGEVHEDHRFYLFVASVWNDQHRIWDETAAREFMTRKAKELHADISDQRIAEVIDERQSQGTMILDFLSVVRESGKFDLLT